MATGVLVADGLELAQQFLLAVGEVDRCFNHDVAHEVARPARADAADALAAQAKYLARLGFGRDLDLRRTVQRGDLDLAAQRGSRETHRHFAVQVIVVPLENRMLLDVDLHEQVTRRAAVDAMFALAGQADAITFVDTGLETPIGERLRRVRPYLDGDPVFLANYGDGLSNIDMNDLIARLPAGHAGSLLAVAPQDSFHMVSISSDGNLTGLEPVANMDMRINGGFFVLRQEIFDYICVGEDLVMHGCVRAAEEGRFSAHRFDGFWACMDTVKERAYLEGLDQSGAAPWKVWLPGHASAVALSPSAVTIPD